MRRSNGWWLGLGALLVLIALAPRAVLDGRWLPFGPANEHAARAIVPTPGMPPGFMKQEHAYLLARSVHDRAAAKAAAREMAQLAATSPVALWAEADVAAWERDASAVRAVGARFAALRPGGFETWFLDSVADGLEGDFPAAERRLVRAEESGLDAESAAIWRAHHASRRASARRDGFVCALPAVLGGLASGLSWVGYVLSWRARRRQTPPASALSRALLRSALTLPLLASSRSGATLLVSCTATWLAVAIVRTERPWAVLAPSLVAVLAALSAIRWLVGLRLARVREVQASPRFEEIDSLVDECARAAVLPGESRRAKDRASTVTVCVTPGTHVTVTDLDDGGGADVDPDARCVGLGAALLQSLDREALAALIVYALARAGKDIWGEAALLADASSAARQRRGPSLAHAALGALLVGAIRLTEQRAVAAAVRASGEAAFERARPFAQRV